MKVTFQVPVQYCSLLHWTLLSSPDTPMAEHHLCIGPAASLFLELLVVVLCSSPGAYWTFWPGRLIVRCHIFLLFHTVHEVLMASTLEWFAILSSIMFCQNSLLWPVCLGWLMASLSYTSPFAMTSLGSMKCLFCAGSEGCGSRPSAGR